MTVLAALLLVGVVLAVLLERERRETARLDAEWGRQQQRLQGLNRPRARPGTTANYTQILRAPVSGGLCATAIGPGTYWPVQSAQDVAFFDLARRGLLRSAEAERLGAAGW